MPAHRTEFSVGLERLSPGEPSGQSRSITKVACAKCRGRKVKCDGDRPKCARCVRLDLACVYEQSGSQAWSVVGELEERLRILESEKAELVGLVGSERTAQMPSDAGLQSDDQHPDVASQRAPSVTGQHPSSESHLSLRPMPTVNISPGAIQHRPRLTDSTIDLDGERVLRHVQLPSNAQLLHQLPPTVLIPSPLQEIQTDLRQHCIPFERHSLPDDDGIDCLIEHFAMYTNAAFPAFHLPTLKATVMRVRSSISTVVCSDYVMILHVLAVACASLPRSSTLHELFSHRGSEFYDIALKAFDEANLSLQQKLQTLILRTQYVLYRPNAGNVWDLSGQAVRAAVDMGLHSDGPGFQNGTLLQRDMGRRLFWSAYCVDRSLCIVLGRPPAISDDWVTAEMPLTEDDSLITEHAVVHSGSPSQLKLAAIAHFQIRRLQSEIQHRLYSPSQKPHGPPSIEWIDDVSRRLQAWRDSNPAATGFTSQQWLSLNYHHTRTLLHRPAPNAPQPDCQALREALSGATGVIQAYKGMYREGRINYNWLAMYQVFTAGVTYLNSLWQAQKNGWAIVSSLLDAILDIQVCASVMEGLAAVTPGTSGIRDAFETVSERILRHLTSQTGGFSAPSSPRLNQLFVDRNSHGPYGNTRTTHTAHFSSDNNDMPGSQSPIRDISGPQELVSADGPNVMREGDQTMSSWDADDLLAALFAHPLGDLTAHDWEQMAVGNSIDYNP